MSTKVDSGIYIHEDIQTLQRHFAHHQGQAVKLPLSKRDQQDFCDHCHPRDEYGQSEVFESFRDWAISRIAISSYNGKSVYYYIQVYRIIASKNYRKADTLKIIRRLLRTFYFSERRSFTNDTESVYRYIKDSCVTITNQDTEEDNQEILPEDKLEIPPIPDNWEDREDQVPGPSAKEKGKAPANSESSESDNESQDTVSDQEAKQQEEPFQNNPEATYDLEDIHNLGNQVNKLAGFLEALDNEETTEEMAQQLTEALQAIFGQNGQHLRSEQGILVVEPFAGKNTEDPVSWLNKFERARSANQWQKRRLVDIAGGLMKGEAANWFEATRNTWGVIARYDDSEEDLALNENDVGTANFYDSFKERFVTDQRKNRWHVELLTLKQGEDTVEEYAAKFLRLIKRVDITDENQKCRMFLFGLNPAYITFVQMSQHEDLNAMIAAAKQVETGFSLSTGKITSPKKKETSKDLDALTAQIQQLSLNYATLANAYVSQTERPNRFGNNNRNNRGRGNFRSSNQRSSSRSRPDITCYNCGKTGHFAKNCYSKSNNNSSRNNNFSNNNRRGGQGRNRSQTRFVLPTNHTRSLNHFSAYDDPEEEYYDDDGYEDDYEMDAYVATRATTRDGRKDYAPTYLRSESAKERELQKKTDTKRPRRKMQPAPIEDATAFEVARYLQELPSGLTIGQAAHLIPNYRQGIALAGKRTRDRSANYNNYSSDESDEERSGQGPTTAMQCELLVGKEPVKAIIDSGAATSIITHKLAKRLGHKISAPSKIVVVTTDGSKVKPLGIIKDFPITINYMKIPTTVEVLESPNDLLLLGNDWLVRVGATLNWKSCKFTVKYKGREETVSATCHADDYVSVRETIPDDHDEIDDDDEYEDHEWPEVPTYYSNTDECDFDSDDDDEAWCNYLGLPKKKKLVNPAIFLANNEKIIDQNDDWNLEKDIHVGPLDQHEHDMFQQMLAENNDVCAKNQMDIGRTSILKHTINTGDAYPEAKTFYESNPVKTEFIRNEVKEMLKKGIIRPSTSPWAAPVVIVKKKDGTERFCVDYRQLNAITKPDRYPIPRISSLLESFREANWFSGLDLASGYWQVEMSKADREKTAFIIDGGLYEFNVMPFGLRNAPGTFQRLMNYVLRDLIGKFVAVYLDDIIIYSKTYEQHIDHLNQVFEALRTAGLKIKLKKCFFCLPEIEFLGHVVGRNGIKPDPKKVDKVLNMPAPTNISELRSILGLFSYYRRFVKDFSRHAKPMLELLAKDKSYKWEKRQQNAFEYLKKRLVEAPILQYPDFNKPFILLTDASGTGLGAVLAQLDDEGKERVIAYASRALTPAEKNYPITEQECLAVIWAVQHFDQYLQLQPFKIVTDHSALKYLQSSKMPKSSRRARWMMELQQYNFEIVHRPGKENANADALSRVMVNYIGVETDKGKHREDCNCDTCQPTVYFQMREPTIDTQVMNDGQIIQVILEDIQNNYPDEEWINMDELQRRESQGMECTVLQITHAILEAAMNIWNANLWEVLKTCARDSKVIRETENLISEYREKLQRENSSNKSDEDDDEVDSDNESYISMDSLKEEQEKLEQLKEKRVRLISPTPWECCGEIICKCYNNENGWGAEYYQQTTTWDDFSEVSSNENWGLPDNENEHDIEALWSIHTPAWTYTNVELNKFYRELVKEKWIIAGQSQTRGRMRCMDYCNTDQHHIHKWCHVCAKRIDWDDNHVPQCKFGIGLGQIKPDMDPNYLINTIFWNEPQAVVEENNKFHKRQQNFDVSLEAMERLNKRDRNGFEATTSRQNSQENLQQNNKRVKRRASF